MAQRHVLRSAIMERAPLVTRAQIVREFDQGALVPSDCTSYSLRIFDATLDASSPVYSLIGAAPSEVLFTSYQTTGWDEDSVGYNFQDILPSDTPARFGGNTLRLEYEIATVSEGYVPFVHWVELLPMWSDAPSP